MKKFSLLFVLFYDICAEDKGPVKLIEWVKIVLLVLNVTSKLFQFTTLNLSG